MSLAHDIHWPLQDKDRMLKTFLKNRGFKDIKYDTHRPHPDYIQTRPDQRLHSCGPNSWTCVLVFVIFLYPAYFFTRWHFVPLFALVALGLWVDIDVSLSPKSLSCSSLQGKILCPCTFRSLGWSRVDNYWNLDGFPSEPHNIIHSMYPNVPQSKCMAHWRPCCDCDATRVYVWSFDIDWVKGRQLEVRAQRAPILREAIF